MTGVALIVQGDALQLPLPDSSVDAICTDPPYSLSFMGRKWDSFGGPQAFQAWCQEWATEALRVLRPGGWLLAFGGTRTWHRLACGIEDAGFEMRDTIAEFGPLAWVSGQGFPKGKACLKPAWEPVIVARKPGSSVLQIDASRVGHASSDDLAASQAKNPGRSDLVTSDVYGADRPRQSVNGAGRWPSNVVLIHDPGCVPVGVRKVRGSGSVTGEEPSAKTLAAYGEFNGRAPFTAYADPDGTETVQAWQCVENSCPVFLLDQQSGEAGSTLKRGYGGHVGFGHHGIYGTSSRDDKVIYGYGDQGGASRFYPTFQAESRLYYTAKAPRNERVTIDGDGHPCVKPLALMRWLVRLVCPPEGVILDMFGGSGTTGEAAMLEGFTAIIIDKDPASCAKAKVRGHPHVRRRTVVTGPLAGPEQGSLL